MTRELDGIAAIEKIIGRNIREKRTKRGLTLSDVATTLKCSYQQVQKYESAKTRVTAATLYKLSSLYNVEIEKFFEGVAEIDIGSDNTDILNSRSGNERMSLMIVEDDPGDEVIIRNALEGFNLNVLCAHDGVQTMAVLRYKTLCRDFPRPDLILLDVYLPGGDGLSVLKDLKRDREIQDIPVVIVSNSINPEMMSTAYKSGAAGYICKSFDFNAFKESITNCLRYWTESVVLPSTVRRYLGRTIIANDTSDG
jgi:CheY-like chemotaxis protein